MDNIEDDPRVQAVAAALLSERELWVTQDDSGEIAFDLDIAGILSVHAIEMHSSERDDDYCRWGCHIDEQQQLLRLLRGYAADNPTDAGVVGKIAAFMQDSPKE